jgi:SAM-dependent methyltransferase
MSEEKPPKLFPNDIHRHETDRWEGSVENEKDAKGWFKAFEHRLTELGVEIRESKVLEIGSGNNIFLKYLREQGVKAVGVGALPRGKTEGLPVVAARIEQLPFPNESFDIVVSTGVFNASEYNQDQPQMMENIARVLKPGGYYIGALNDTKESVENLKLVSSSNETFRMDIFRKS